MTHRAPLFVLLLAAATFAPAVANADPSCTQDSDCSKGFTCQMTGISGCPPVAPCPLKAAVDGGTSGAGAPDDADAEACDTVACDPVITKQCEPGPCQSDGDCATGMVCHPDSIVDCPTVVNACAKDETCPAVDAGPCTTTTVSTCIPQYDLPCQTASDCGDGFDCLPDTTTECSGGASGGFTGSGQSTTASGDASASAPVAAADGGPVASPPSEAADAMPSSSPAPLTCTTTTLSTSSCVAKTIPCAADGDCPSTWSCEAQDTASSGCAVPTGSNAAPVACDAGAPVQPSMLCVPPYGNIGGGESLGVSGSNGAGTGSTPTSSVADGGIGASGRSAPGAGATNGSTTDAATGGSGGCQMGAGSTGGGIFGFAFAGLAALVTRRRRRA